MTSYLLDTNVVSELAPGRSRAREALRAWLAAREDRLFLSVVTVVEIQAGVLKTGRLSPGARREALAAWAGQVEDDFADRVLPITRAAAASAAVIADRNLAAGLQPGWPDIAVAATAASHGMALLTRNVRHFTAAGISLFAPFASLPEDAP